MIALKPANNDIEFLNKLCMTTAEVFKSVAEKNEIIYKQYHIDCSLLIKDFGSTINITEEEWFQPILEYSKSPTVYVVEKLDGPENLRLLELYRNYRFAKGPDHQYRNTSALKRNPDIDTQYLYVGKVKQAFYGRVIQHLGFYINKDTGAMQIFHWLNQLPMKICFHAYHFPITMADHMGLFELTLARKYQPLLGKHKL